MGNTGIYKNNYSRIFAVRLQFSMSQPFVCGELKDVVEYDLSRTAGIDYFVEINTSDFKPRKVNKKEMKTLLMMQGQAGLCEKLFEIW